MRAPDAPPGSLRSRFSLCGAPPPHYPPRSGLPQSLKASWGRLPALWRASSGLLKAAGAARLPVRVQLRRDGVGDHALQDVVLRGHHVLDQEVGGVADVEVVLKGERCPLGAAKEDTPTREPPRHLGLDPVTFHPLECRVWMPQEADAGAPVTHGCQQRVCERL